MDTSIFNDPRLQQARTASQNAAQTASSSQQASLSLPDMLRSVLTKKFSTDNPVLKAREGALSDYFNQTTQAPLSVTPTSAGGTANVVFNPQEQAHLIQGRRTAALGPLTSLNTLFGLQTGGLEDVIGAGTRAFQAQTAADQSKAQSARQNYEDVLTELSKRADEAYRNKELLLKEKGVGTSSGRATQVLNSVANDARSGKTLQEIMRTYATQADVTPDDILRIYNTNSIYGPAKESPDELQKTYGVKSTETADIKNRRAALQPALSSMSRLDDRKIDKIGPQNQFANLQIKYLGGFGVDKDILQLNTQFETIRQTALKAFQGGRLSDKDYERIINNVPVITDTPDNARIKINELKIVLKELGGDFSSNNSSNENDWERIG